MLSISFPSRQWPLEMVTLCFKSWRDASWLNESQQYVVVLPTLVGRHQLKAPVFSTFESLPSNYLLWKHRHLDALSSFFFCLKLSDQIGCSTFYQTLLWHNKKVLYIHLSLWVLSFPFGNKLQHLSWVHYATFPVDFFWPNITNSQ